MDELRSASCRTLQASSLCSPENRSAFGAHLHACLTAFCFSPGRSVPTCTHQDHETKVPCSGTQALPGRFHHADLQYQHCVSSNERAPFLTFRCQANEMRCDRPFLGKADP